MTYISWLFVVISLILLFFISPTVADETYGNIMVQSDQPGAMVSLDDFTNTFTTPYQFDGIKTGRHKIKVIKPGYRMYTNNDVVVSPGMTASVYAALVKDSDYGTIRVNSNPPGADVLVDGIVRGKTPTGELVAPNWGNLIVGNLQDGSHTVLVKFAGYSDYSQTVTIGPEKTGPVVVSASLKPVKTVTTTVPPTAAPIQTTQQGLTTGTLTIESIPAGAQVMMNGTMKGVTPVTLESLPAGEYSFTLSLAQYTPVTTSAEVKSGQISSKSVSLIPVPTTLVTAIPTTQAQIPVTPIPTEQSGFIAPISAFLAIFCVLGVMRKKK